MTAPNKNSQALSQRLARERAILARLQHPAIAVLYDAGLADGGRPYLALEYVDGVPIDAWCQGRSIEDILRLMVQVARAVAYAHGQLVIHRDLKPANVLVTPSGLPKLLDFGISKLVEGEATAAEATALTRLAGRPMTLAYAAPEQVLGLPVTVAADIYALGVMLFELLAQARLYRSTNPRDLEAEILQGDLRSPSSVAAQARARQLRGDLDAIVATALKRQPGERYDSAAALADDLERYLGGEPVKARPDSRAYRLRKFVARHALAVGAATAIVAALGVGLGVALWQTNVAREQAARATALNRFVLGLIRQADPNASRETKAADVAMLNAIEGRIDREFEGSPEQLLELRITVGEAYKNRGEMMAARRVFQRAVDEAAPRIPADDLMLLTAEVRAADDRLVVSTAAGEQLARAIAVLRTKAEKDPAAAELLLDALLLRIELAQNYGVPAYLTGDEQTAAIAEVEALALQHFGPGSRQHLRATKMVATLAQLRRGAAAAVPVLASALEQARARQEDMAASAEYLALAADHARFQCAIKEVPAGLATLWHLTAAVRAAHGANSYLLEPMYEAIAECLASAGDPTAFGWVLDAYEIAASREQPPSTNLMRRALAAFNWAAGGRDFEAAERYYQRAIDNARAFPEEAIRERQTLGLRNARVCQLMQRGDAAEAMRVAEPLIAYYNDVYAKVGRLTPAQGNIWICIADALRQLGRFDEAIRIADTFAERCIALKKLVPAANCEQRAYVMRALAQLDAGRIDAALATAREHLTEAWPALLGAGNREGRAVNVQARLMLATGRAAEAVEILRDDYGRWLSMQPSSPYAAESLYWLGRAYQAVGDRRGDWIVPQAKRELGKSPVATHRKLAAGQAIP